MVIRYVVKMKNGSYMVQIVDDDNSEIIHITTVDLPIDADLLKSRSVAERCVEEIISGDTNLLVLYDDGNPPVSVTELEIDYKMKTI